MKAIVTRGLPASGKSSFARQWVAAGNGEPRVELNRDRVRLELAGVTGVLDAAGEEAVTKICYAKLEYYAAQGYSVVISDTNLIRRHLVELIAVLDGLGFAVELRDFDGDLPTLIARDSKREHPVGEQIIRDLARRFQHRPPLEELMPPVFLPLANDPSLAKAVVFDIDGTLATHTQRDPLDFERVGEDLPNHNVIQAARLYRESGYTVIVLSGRPDSCRKDTVAWLETHAVPYDYLYMRRAGDERGDASVKYEIAQEHFVGKWFIETIVDDRDSVVRMWRTVYPDLPTRCFQVNYGDF